MMKKCVLVLLTFWVVVAASAQEHKFSPEKFQADMEAFLTREANLTQQEAARLFPILRQMQQNSVQSMAVCANSPKRNLPMRLPVPRLSVNVTR